MGHYTPLQGYFNRKDKYIMASVTFKRTNNIDSVPITDGQLIFDTSDQKIYLDNGNTREVYGGGSGTDLISNVSDATDNNAFNANATVNLFTRKSSIVDTKAEIQSVTQAGVPLGCKGFNEVIGTSDISALGDGSVTGAILANKSAIDTVNQNLTYRWNPTTDYFEHYKNGQWIQDKFAGFNGIFYMKNGTVSTIAQGASAYPYIASGQQGYTAKAVNAVKQGDYMVISDTGGAYSGIYAFANPVKCVEISKVKITLSGSKTAGGYTMNANLNFMTPLADGFTTIAQIGDVFGGSATELSERVIELTLPNTTQEGYIGFALKSYLGTITLNIKDVELVPR